MKDPNTWMAATDLKNAEYHTGYIQQGCGALNLKEPLCRVKKKSDVNNNTLLCSLLKQPPPTPRSVSQPSLPQPHISHQQLSLKP